MRVLIVADNALAAEVIRRELRQASGFQVIGFISVKRFCAATVEQQAADVVLLDDPREVDLTLSLLATLRSALPAAKLMLLTVDTTATWMADAAAAGADAAIAKTISAGSLGTLVREVVRDRVFHSFTRPAVVARSDAMRSLTSRELEILRLAAAGSSNSVIAERLWVTQQTVKFHLSNVYRKLGVANRTQAAHFAHQHGFLGPEPDPSPQARPRPVPAAA